MLKIIFILSILSVSVYAESDISNKKEKPPEKPVLSVEMKGSELFNALVSQAVNEVDKRIEERESKRWTYIGSIGAAVIALFGFIGISDLRRRVSGDIRDEMRDGKILKSIVDQSIKENLTKDIEIRLEKISDEFYFYQFSNLASGLKYGGRKGFTNKERDSALKAIRVLSSQDEINQRDDFAMSLETIIDKFAAADLNPQLDEIDRLLPQIVIENNGIVQTFMQHYGMRVLGEIEISEDLVERFKKYAEACKKHNVYELALPYLMVYEFSKGEDGVERKINSYIQDSSYLSDDEKETLNKLLTKNIDPSNVAHNPTGQVVRFCEKFASFYEEYEEKLQKEVFA